MSPRKKISIQPVTLFVVTLILLTMFSVFALIEFFQSKHEILSIMEDEGLVLLDALMAGAERSVLAYEALESQMQNRLMDHAYAFETFDYHTYLNPEKINALATTFNLFRIEILNTRGVSIFRSGADLPAKIDDTQLIPKWLAPLFHGNGDSVLTGFGEGKYGRNSRYAVAVRRRRGGAIVVDADVMVLLEMRREVGPGRFVQEIGSRSGVVYVVLQDTLGIQMASRSVQQISSILKDPFLLRIFQEHGQASRIASFNHQEVFEIAASFHVEDQQIGLFRIGLTMNAYRSLMKSARIRLLFIGISLLFLGIVGFALVVVTQNVRLLSESYKQIQTHTGEILQNLEDAVVAVDGAGIITVFNSAAESIYQLRRDTVIGTRISEYSLSCFELLKETLTTGEQIKAQENQCEIQNQQLILRLSTSVIRNSSKIIDAAILVASDITEQRQLEKQLQRQEKLQAMGALASGVAHEVRNPINAIGMIAQRFQKEFQPKKDLKEYQKLTRAMREEVGRINGIIQQFLEFAKPPALQCRILSIEKLFDDVHAVFNSSATSKKVIFEVKVNDQVVLDMDFDQMKQALLNLLNNGLDACRPGDRLNMSGYLENQSYIIEIKDTGRGIPESELGRIFDLYYTTKAEGTGIGLPMVVQIIQGHGGTIEVHSELNHGSCFKIRLPCQSQGKSAKN
ncbi:PAS domain-containing protein [bacterium]|nr:PAS domain-containing protein [bacterium]